MQCRLFFKYLLSSCCNRINNYLIEKMKEHNVSVVGYAIIDNYKIVAADTLSIRDDINVSKKTLLQSCSLSKPVTACGVLQLAAKRKIDIDKPLNAQLSDWKIPESKHGNGVNVRQSLSMTSGLCYGELNAVFPGYMHNKPIPTLDNILYGEAPATNLPIRMGSVPGSDYRYTGAGYMVLQKLIEEVSGKSFSQFMDVNVLRTLGMVGSIFQHPLNDQLKASAVPGFNANSEMVKGGWDIIPTLASGGLWSTPSDLANLAIGIANAYLGEGANPIIPQELAIEMLTRQQNSSFGLGVVIDGEGNAMNFRKNGHNTGYHNELIMFPNAGQGIVIMTNSSAGISLINNFVTFIAKRYNWPPYSPNFDEITVLKQRLKSCL